MIYRRFKLDPKITSYLSGEDKKILKILEGAVRDIAKVYELQVKSGFYPKNSSKQDVERAARDNPDILSPFTIVEKKDSKLDAILYHKKYAKFLGPIADKIDQAANISTNPSFKKYLKSRAKSLRDGSYREADIVWLNVKNSAIDFSIAPFERYLDKMFFIKRIFQAHVGVIDLARTANANKIKEALYTSAKLSPEKYHSTNIPKKGVQVLVENTPATAGYMADVLFSGEHFPSDLDIMQQYGSKIIYYRSQMDLKFNKLYYPIFKLIFEKRFAARYSKELLLQAVARNALLYELGRQLHKFEGARERLKELYGPIDEANGFASGIQHSKHLVVKGLLSQEELEAIIIMHIVWMFSDWLFYKQSRGMDNYILGDAILLNTFITKGALKEKEGISWPNFSKIFFEIEELADQLVELLRSGSYKKAENLVKRHSDFSNFEKLGKNLGNLKVSI